MVSGIVSSILFGLWLFAIPALVIGLLRPQAIAIGGWPRGRGGVIAFSALLFWGGLIGGMLTNPEGGNWFGENGLVVVGTFAGLTAAAIVRLLRLERATAPTPPADAPLLAELAQARARSAAIRAAATVLGDLRLQTALVRVATAADGIIAEVIRDPGRFPAVRRALVHHLGDVAAIASGLAAVKRATGETALSGRVLEALDDLSAVLTSHRRTLAENEALRLDARLTVLEQQLRDELGTLRGQSPPPP